MIFIRYVYDWQIYIFSHFFNEPLFFESLSKGRERVYGDCRKINFIFNFYCPVPANELMVGCRGYEN